jgi:hypothetical protein
MFKSESHGINITYQPKITNVSLLSTQDYQRFPIINPRLPTFPYYQPKITKVSLLSTQDYQRFPIINPRLPTFPY